MASPNVPEVIGGYRVLEVLSVGGMGTVYRARDLKIGRDVAIKLLRKELDDQGVRESFAREARPVSRLNHRNIVTIFEIGEHNGLPFIAMEYVHGETLASFLRRHPPVTLSRKLQIMEQICSGLEYAHRMGVVHRDIKPANIMIDDEGTPKILDFGMARMGRSKNTQAGQITGTLNYMAPEQITGMAADSRGDVFSIGAVFYELLSYRKAFPGDTPSTIIHEVLYRQPEPLEILDPNLDPALISTVTRCLEKQPEVRHADLGAVRKALVAVSHRLQSAEHQVDSEPYPTTSMPVPAPYAWSAETPPPSRSRKDSVEQVRGRADQTRAKQLQSHLDVAEDALDQGDCEGALEACEQALILDPTSPQALDLETRARAALDRLLEERLAAARAEFDRSALTAAELLTDQVLAIKPDSAEAIQIRHHIERARLRLVEERERERERQRALDQACAEAELHLTAGALDSAAQAIERALSFDAGSRDALALKERITAATAAVREARHRADVEWKRHEAEAEHQRLAADAARLAQESAARSKLEAEVERRKQEAEMDRRRFEAETGRLKRDAEGERLKREAEAQRRAAEAKALDSEAEGSPPPFMEVTVFYGTDPCNTGPA
jgi:serine/threonine-protein kinase